MKYLLLLLILLSAAATSLSQTSLKQGAKVGEIGLGSTKEAVIKNLGKPLSESKKDAGECVGGIEMTLKYPGLVLSLWDDDDPKKFTVGSFVITSPKWKFAGANIGQKKADIIKVFGRSDAEEGNSDNGSAILFYEMSEDAPGSTNFTFKKGKLVEIRSFWRMC